MAFQVYDERILFTTLSLIQNANGTGAVATWTADALSRRVDAITITSSDTVDRNVVVNVNINAADIPLFEILVPAGSGHGVLAPVEVLAAMNVANLPALCLGPNCSLRFNVLVAVTAAKAIDIITWGGVF